MAKTIEPPPSTKIASTPQTQTEGPRQEMQKQPSTDKPPKPPKNKYAFRPNRDAFRNISEKGLLLSAAGGYNEWYNTLTQIEKESLKRKVAAGIILGVIAAAGAYYYVKKMNKPATSKVIEDSQGRYQVVFTKNINLQGGRSQTAEVNVYDMRTNKRLWPSGMLNEVEAHDLYIGIDSATKIRALIDPSTLLAQPPVIQQNILQGQTLLPSGQGPYMGDE